LTEAPVAAGTTGRGNGRCGHGDSSGWRRMPLEFCRNIHLPVLYNAQ
jgi:hypothetical protein